jgi:hypothetical protein
MQPNSCHKTKSTLYSPPGKTIKQTLFMITLTQRAAALIATGLFTLGMQAQKQPKNNAAPKAFGKQKQFVPCGTVEYNSKQNNAKFEQWLAPKVAQIKAGNLQKSTLGVNAVVTIPVVVHVIHNGDVVGQNENIADAQVLSQITVLNQDFRKMFDTPGYNTNPVGADAEIEFCLAQRDPAGLYSTGITRHNLGPEGSWDMEAVEVMKTQTQWDPNKYLNIWVVSGVSLGQGYILAGYAQFPTQSGLQGLGGQTSTANTDGVVIAYEYFGSEDIYPQGNYTPAGSTGRSATHEVGHFFGLRHIWGDEDNCSATDFCADTPSAFTANAGCPAAGFDSCPNSPGVDMIQNYMDYTSDECKNIFTADQKVRMQAVLALSPRRNSLTTSNGCVPGVTYDNDGSLNIQSFNTSCSSSNFTPEVVLKNTGNNPITSATFTYKIDNAAPATYTFTGNLTAGQQVVITLTGLTATQGAHTFTTAMVTVNGVADQAPANDAITTPFSIIQQYNTNQVITVTINTDDYGAETIWALLDSDENPVAGNVDFETGEINYYDDNETYVTEVAVESNQCYTFAILDFEGDGMCCEYGNGSYSVTTSTGTIIAQGGAFEQQELTDFGIQNATLSTGSFNMSNGIALYPNPANSVISIAVPQSTTLPDSYTVYNSLGQVVGSGKIASNSQQLNISTYANGVYFVKLQGTNGAQTLQFIKY